MEVEQQPDWEQTVIGQVKIEREKRVPLAELNRVCIEGMWPMAEKMMKLMDNERSQPISPFRFERRIMKKINLNDIGLMISVVAGILAILNIFWIDIPRDIIYVLCFFGVTCNWAHAMRQYKKYSDLYLLKQREVLDLVWSYREMGSYIDRFQVPELHDLDARIEIELNDIKIRKKNFAEQLGIKDGIEQ